MAKKKKAPVVEQKIEELKEQLITEQEEMTLGCCMSTKTKVAVVLVLLALWVYYFIS